jgi:hypothetical protein
MSRHSRTRRTLMKFWRSSCSYWRFAELVGAVAAARVFDPFPQAQVAENSLFSSSNFACCWSACCLRFHRPVAHVLHASAEAMTSTSSSAPRVRASRIMRPTRGSSGSWASSAPVA